MGNTTTDLVRSRRAAEAAARIGVRLAADLVELYVVEECRADVVAQWSASIGSTPCTGVSIPLSWFPWSLGNIRPEDYMFIRNGGRLELEPGVDRTIGDLGMSSVVHVPLLASPTVVIGAICAYWSVERSSWDASACDVVRSWALDALSLRR